MMRGILVIRGGASSLTRGSGLARVWWGRLRYGASSGARGSPAGEPDRSGEKSSPQGDRGGSFGWGAAMLCLIVGPYLTIDSSLATRPGAALATWEMAGSGMRALSWEKGAGCRDGRGRCRRGSWRRGLGV